MATSSLHQRQTFQSLTATSAVLSLAAFGLWSTYGTPGSLTFETPDLSGLFKNETALTTLLTGVGHSADKGTLKQAKGSVLTLTTKIMASQQALAWLKGSLRAERTVKTVDNGKPGHPALSALTTSPDKALVRVKVRDGLTARFAREAFPGDQKTASSLMTRTSFSPLVKNGKGLVIAQAGSAEQGKARASESVRPSDLTLAALGTSNLNIRPSVSSTAPERDKVSLPLPRRDDRSSLASRDLKSKSSPLSSSVLSSSQVKTDEPVSSGGREFASSVSGAEGVQPFPVPNPLRMKPVMAAKAPAKGSDLLASLTPVVRAKEDRVSPVKEVLPTPSASKPLPATTRKDDSELHARIKAAYREAFEGDPAKLDAKGRLAYSEKDKQCLSEAIYFEARGEPIKGQMAVAQVVINRTVSPIYPGTLCGVVYQQKNRRDSCQFSFACDGIAEVITDRHSWDVAKKIANDMLLKPVQDMNVVTTASTHYHANYVSPNWINSMTKVSRIGQHIFYEICWSCEEKQGRKKVRRKRVGKTPQSNGELPLYMRLSAERDSR